MFLLALGGCLFLPDRLASRRPYVPKDPACSYAMTHGWGGDAKACDQARVHGLYPCEAKFRLSHFCLITPEATLFYKANYAYKEGQTDSFPFLQTGGEWGLAAKVFSPTPITPVTLVVDSTE